MRSPFPLMVGLFLVFYFMVLRPGKRREQMIRENMFNSLKKNDKVLTAGGIIGNIALINEKEDEVVLKIDESANARLRVLKSSIVRNYTQEETAAREKEQAAKTKDEAVAAAKS